MSPGPDFRARLGPSALAFADGHHRIHDKLGMAAAFFDEGFRVAARRRRGQAPHGEVAWNRQLFVAEVRESLGSQTRSRDRVVPRIALHGQAGEKSTGALLTTVAVHVVSLHGDVAGPRKRHNYGKGFLSADFCCFPQILQHGLPAARAALASLRHRGRPPQHRFHESFRYFRPCFDRRGTPHKHNLFRYIRG